MEDALAPRTCNVSQSTSDEAPGLRADVEQPLGAHHSPALFHGQRALSKAVAAPMAVPQRAAAKAVAQAEETLKRVHTPLNNATSSPEKRGPGCPPKAAASPEQVAQGVAAARHEHQRLTRQRKQVTQSMRAIGHPYYFVDVKAAAAKLAGVFQRSSSIVEGRNGYLSLRNHALPWSHTKSHGI